MEKFTPTPDDILKRIERAKSPQELEAWIDAEAQYTDVTRWQQPNGTRQAGRTQETVKGNESRPSG